MPAGALVKGATHYAVLPRTTSPAGKGRAMHIIHYKVDGLDCAEEVAILRRDIGGLAGVLNLEFDVVNARMSVEYDPEAMDPANIVLAVARTGMQASAWEQRLTAGPRPFWERHG